MWERLKNLLRDDNGPTAVEYAVLLALLVIAVIGPVQVMSNATADSFNESAAQISSAIGS